MALTFMCLLVAPAYANEPPVIRSPDKTSYTVTEGDAFVLPVQVHEPDNDVVEYSVEYLVQGVAQPALPKNAVFETDSKTAERRFLWWPDLSQAGIYDFMFRATDERGASAEKRVTITVTDRTTTPAVKVTKTYPMPGYQAMSLVVDRVVIREGEVFSVLVEAFDPEGETVSVEFAGLPNAKLSALGPGRYVWEWTPSTWPTGSHPDAGIHQGAITGTDSAGNSIVVNQTVDVRRVWDHATEIVFVRPIATGGVVRDLGEAPDQTGFRSSIVRGTVAFGLESILFWHTISFPMSAEVRYQYVLHTPDASGNDVRTPISGILTGPREITWDSTTLPDGSYAVDVELLDGGTTAESEIHRYRSRSLYVIVDNVAGAVTGPQWLPNTGLIGTKADWYEPTDVQWIRYSGTQEHAVVRPYPYAPIAAPQTDAERQALAAANQWFAEPWLKSWNARYFAEPGLFRTQEGHLVSGGAWEYLSEDSRYSEFFPETDGGRNQASVTNQISLRPDPLGAGFLGVGVDGRLVRIDPTNTTKVVETIAGWVTRSDVVPYLSLDFAVSLTQRQTEQKRLVGVFENGIPFKFSSDLVVDPENPNLIYVADTLNHRVALVDRSGPQAFVTTFAGKPGEAGYANGGRLDAQFNYPTSVEIVGRTLYVVDRENLALRAIDLRSGQVMTPVGKGPTAPTVPDRSTVKSNLDAWTFASASFDDAALVYPQWVRRYSNGDLLLTERTQIFDPGNLRRIRFVEERVDQLYTPDSKPIRNVRGFLSLPDWQGKVGPVDDVLMLGFLDADHGMTRISLDGRVTTRLFYLSSPLFYPGGGDTPQHNNVIGSYPVGGLAIDNNESRFTFTGQNQSGLIVVRPLTPTDPDPSSLDTALSSYGRDLYFVGTLFEFARSPGRPSLASLHGRYGFNRYGNILHFDDLVSKSDAELAAYIQSGMGGKIARPELTGRDLQAMIYFIRVQSLQGKLENIDKNQIAANLQTAGYWDNLSDIRLPEIRDVQSQVVGEGVVEITWQTDEPTIGLAQYGPTDYYGLSSAIEPGYAKDHAITLTNLTQDKRYYLRIPSKDQAGNLTHYQASFDVGTPPPILCGDVNKDGRVDIADVVLVIQAILGIKPDPGCQADVALPKGSLTLADVMRILDVVLGKTRQEDLSCCGG